MMGLFRASIVAAALLALLITIACGDDGGESTPAPQSTAASPAAHGMGSSTGVGASPTPHLTVTPQAALPSETPAGGAIEMGVDVDTTGNTASELGTLDSCVRLDVPNPSFDGVSDHSIDVYVKGATLAPKAYDAWLTYAAVNDGCLAKGEAEVDDMCLNSSDDDGDTMINDGCPQVGASAESGAQCTGDNRVDDDSDAIVHVAAPDTDTLIKMPGAADLAHESLPDTDGTFAAGVIYLSGGPGLAGDGALLRLGLDIGGSGVVTLALNPPPLSAYASQIGVHSVTLAQQATLAVNQDCP
jgi:hypothetical protein